ncbi:darcynin family protein [Deinococcus misasensis]|uniref:darcynin family protein n=1 Tax=Deinococcus misasensis TaxID=392413 RepID=UPI00054F9DC1|nr:darcynin family protein [Deinococcus misasensis]
MYTILFLFTFSPAWLALSRAERQRMQETHVQPLLDAHQTRVSASFCDAEAFTGRCSDFVVFQAQDLKDFYFFFEALRDTPLFSVPFLTVNDLIVGVQQGHQQYQQQLEEA